MNTLLKFAKRVRSRFARTMLSALHSKYFIYFWRNPEVAAAVAAAGLFDREWYLSQNPDVVSAGINPFTHYVRYGAKEGRNPSPKFDVAEYRFQNPHLKASGADPFIHFITSPQRTDTIVRKRFLASQPLRLYRTPGAQARINLVADSINVGSLSDGLSSAVIFASLFANKIGASLRIITRIDRADERSLQQVLLSAGISHDQTIEFSYAELGNSESELDLSDRDTFITTSWLTTQCVRDAAGAKNIVYFVREDERLLYPMGDDYLRCSELLGSNDLRFVVSTKLLYDHLVSHGNKNISNQGIWFEPAFPQRVFFRQTPSLEGRKNFLFYASPHNSRQLYYRGLEAINLAVHSGVLDETDWRFYLVYKNLPPIKIGQGQDPEFVEIRCWEDYCTLLRRTDLGLCLAYTPHPSNQSLDLAACGAVAVTNRFGVKHNLDDYSNNIVCSDSDVDSLVGALSSGARMVMSEDVRRKNFEQAKLSRDWSTAFTAVVARLTRE